MTPYARSRVATDGSTYAWYAAPTVLGWWAPGERQPTYLRLASPVQDAASPRGPLVAGRHVILDSLLVDVPAHAVAPLSTTTGLFSPQRRATPGYTGSSVIAGLAFGTEPGRFINGYWADSSVQVIRLDTRGLPPLAC